MNATEYKRYHKSFMENNHGTSLVHTFVCIFHTVQCAFKISMGQKYKSKFIQYVYEYVVIVLPMIIFNMVLSGFIEIPLFLDSQWVMFKLTSLLSNNMAELREAFLSNNKFKSTKIQSITFMRGLTYLITIFSILAVDFADFPRYLAKTEKFGYSFMDTGVGLFVLMSGLVHRSVSNDNFVSVLKGNLKFITVLVVLGVARFVSLKHLDYQEHVSEYGVHWNFFFTLAVCKLFGSILLFYFQQPLQLSLFTIFVHESLLHNFLQDWVFSDTPRISFIDANREGITSSLGYVSLYLFAVYIKQELSDQSAQRFLILKKLTGGTVLFLVLSNVMHFFKPTSRVLANASYCFYVSSILITVLTLLYIFDVLAEEKVFHFEVPLILSDINKNGLLCFLVANLATGFINKMMQTLLVPILTTFVVLNIYMMFTITVTWYLNKIGLSI